MSCFVPALKEGAVGWKEATRGEPGGAITFGDITRCGLHSDDPGGVWASEDQSPKYVNQEQILTTQIPIT